MRPDSILARIVGPGAARAIVDRLGPYRSIPIGNDRGFGNGRRVDRDLVLRLRAERRSLAQIARAAECTERAVGLILAEAHAPIVIEARRERVAGALRAETPLDELVERLAERLEPEIAAGLEAALAVGKVDTALEIIAARGQLDRRRGRPGSAAQDLEVLDALLVQFT